MGQTRKPASAGFFVSYCSPLTKAQTRTRYRYYSSWSRSWRYSYRTSYLPDKTRYHHYDNLGSVDTITDGQGNVVERLSYQPFGERRYSDWRDSSSIIIPLLTNRGFTGHEHIDEAGVINMNGRIYDPEIGQFLSPDPLVQAPGMSQSYNRYSYVWNNPMKYTDPSGYWGIPKIKVPKVISDTVGGLSKGFNDTMHGIAMGIGETADGIEATVNETWDGAGEWVRDNPEATQVAVMAITVASGGTAGPFVAAGLQAGLVKVNGGSNEQALFAATVSLISAGNSYVIGGAFEGEIARAVAHGISQGMMSHMTGGTFQAGFIAGASGSIAGDIASPSQGDSWQTAVGKAHFTGTVGGLASVAGGGKFEDGYRSAAMVYMFNHMEHSYDHQFEDSYDTSFFSDEPEIVLAQHTNRSIPGGGGSGPGSSQLGGPIYVTPNGVAIAPKSKYRIPDDYVQNPHRSGSYGTIQNGKFKEQLRIDPATPPGSKGPNYSHYHKNGKKQHLSPRPGDQDPGF